MEFCLISAVKGHEKNKEKKSKEYERSKSKKKKKKKKRSKPGKVNFSSVDETVFVLLFYYLQKITSDHLRSGIASGILSFSLFLHLAFILLNN